MAAADIHTRVVAWLKVALPLAALALLSTLFLLADRVDPEDAIPYAKVDVKDLAHDPRMTAPAYAGITEDGGALTVTAETARPASDIRAAEATGVVASLKMPDGGTADISAAEAKIDEARQELHLSGGIALTTSSGYLVLTDGMVASLARSYLHSTGPIAGQGPAGKFSAAAFNLTRQDAADGASDYILLFSGGVTLIYQPGL